jgi:hypothetical protein
LAVALIAHTGAPSRATVTVAAAAPKTTTTTLTPNQKPTTAFCDLLRSYAEDVRRITISLTDPAALKPLLDHAVPAVTESASVATPAAAPDVVGLRSALADLQSGLDAAGYDFAKLRPDAALGLMSPGFMASFGRLQALASERC